MFRPKPHSAIVESAFFKLPDTLLLVFGTDLALCLISEAWATILGYPLAELRERSFADLLHEDDREAAVAKLASLDAEHPTLRFSTRCRRKDGGYLGVAWNVIFDAAEGLYYASAHETAFNLSSDDARLPEPYIDALTGLPNRRLFIDRLEHTQQRAMRRNDLRFAVLYSGIDRLKVVNHKLGHSMGDLLLVNMANVLRSCIRPTDMAARMDGDEFALLLEDVRDVPASMLVAHRIQEKLSLPFSLDGHEVFTSISFGIVISKHDASAQQTPDEMIRDANMAMMRGKAQGGGNFVVFDQASHDRAVRRMELELDLRHAIEQDQFHVYYQPIIRMQNMELVGFEALVRWNHPEKGLISPDEFIPVAEETGLIVPVGRFVLREACRQMKKWNEERRPGSPELNVSVNLSNRQLLHPDLLRDVEEALRDSGLAPTMLKLEITESVMMEQADHAIELLNRLKEMQILLLLDDFGTGYSSLSYLHRLPIDTLKIDRSFISNLHSDDRGRHFVETIVHLAHKLGLDIICEGVELEVQANILIAMGAECSQGFYYSRPVAAHEAEMLLVAGLDSPSEDLSATD
ncbi:MAG TPA: GGDEF domain-containing protein [Burkholderiaceae bacterium]|jgi:diguanylate cyclase (GGDEF)-like protein/PAS domain S-box-containing protein